MSQNSTANLIQDALAGNQQAYAEIVNRYKDQITTISFSEW